MVLYIIGLGLFDHKDIPLRGLEAVKKSERVWLENYTSILHCPTAELEEAYGKKIELATRTDVESESDKILRGADVEDVSFLVVGDPVCATTHTDLMIR
ncbi:hypothetical protein TL16_g05981 [Triparma laevis f. inornata]|uniref:diphthine methyl ester synthase n=1 Tax=Triparma laevis f. inornata TaxID=1714386 RepID=A0A9W7AQR7_9STRA|nr:hypothetical protein TL16_g05981 [Triparma laevis f. inornata]